MTDKPTATWLGGPWDGQSMTLEHGLEVVEAFDPRDLHTEAEAALLGVEHLPQPRTCPVVERHDGQLIIDWNSGTTGQV